MKDMTLLHTERTDGLVLTVSAHKDGRFSIHTRKRWQHGVRHIGFTQISRQQVLALGLSRELEEAERG